MPSRRSTKLRLKLDTEGKQLVADGSDFIVVVAEVTDIVVMFVGWQRRILYFPLKAKVK